MLGSVTDMPKARPRKATWLFRVAVGLMERGEVDPYIVIKDN